MRQYGKNMVITENGNMTKSNLIESLKNRSANLRQADRIESDIKNILELPDENKYYIYFRQYTGHKYQPSKVNGVHDIIYISKTIWWN